MKQLHFVTSNLDVELQIEGLLDNIRDSQYHEVLNGIEGRLANGVESDDVSLPFDLDSIGRDNSGGA